MESLILTFVFIIVLGLFGYAVYDYFYRIRKIAPKNVTNKTKPNKTTEKERDKVFFTDARLRIGIILEYRKCLGKLLCGMGNESDLTIPKKLIKIALIEELMFPRKKGLAVQKEEFIKFLEGCLLKVDDFIPSEKYNKVKLFDQEMAGGYDSWVSRTEEILKDLDTKEVVEFIEKNPAWNFAEVFEDVTPKNLECLCLIELLEKFRENPRSDSVIKQLCEIINKIAKE